MKRAKIMLLAIMVIAVVGGALAFKAQRFSHKDVYCATTDGTKIYCTTTDFKTTAVGNPSFSTPCETWHNALGLGATRTSTYYTTTGIIVDEELVRCPNPLRATVTTTNVP